MGIFFFLFAIGVALYAHKKKGRNGPLWFVGLMLANAAGQFYSTMGGSGSNISWQLFILIVAGLLLFGEESKVVGKTVLASNDIKTCEYCAEEIKVEAKLCKHCGKDVQTYMKTL